MRRIFMLFYVLVLTNIVAFAQQRTISGVVRDAEGAPIPFATITETGTKNAVQADGTGKFSISISQSAKLSISASGYQIQNVSPSGNAVDITLNRGEGQLQEVVVTALGIRRKSDALSYATQGIKSDRLTTTRTLDLNNALAGKISGLQVRSESAAKLGSSASVRLRGAGSIVDKNPLYVLDGTPIDDPSAVNMDDVDDVQVLKGPAATALYGQRADAGVILLTSKKGKKRPGLGIEASSTVAVNSVGILPKFQNEYSGGTPGVSWQTYTWKTGDPVEWKALDGKKYHTYYDDASWGPKMDGSEYIPWYAWFPGTKYSFKTASLTPQPNNVRDFYDKGVQLINNVAFSSGNDLFNSRISYTNQTESGLLPYSKMGRNILSTQNSINLNTHLSATANITFFNQRVDGEFSDAYGNTASGSFLQWFHRDLDVNILRELKDLRTPYGRIASWNLDDQTGVSADAFYNGTLFWTNPYTYFDLITSTKKTDRIYGDVGLTYKFDNHFKVSGTVRRNQMNQNYESKLPYIFEISAPDLQSVLAINENDPLIASTIRPVRATYRTFYVKRVENNYELIGYYNQSFGNFALDFNAGGNIRKNEYSFLDNGTKGGLVVPDLFTLSNSAVQPYYFDNYRSGKEVRSVFGRGSATWNDIATVDFSVRNDWSSALPANANSYLYPSVGASLVLTKYIQTALPFISYTKLRSSWAKVGSDLEPYQLSLTYSPGNTQWNGNIVMGTPDKAVDPNIKPALSTAWEGGLDLRFINNRIGFSGTYYNETKTNEILTIPVAGSSGFTSQLLNAGKIIRKGIELTLDATPIQNKNLSWVTSLNFAKNSSSIVELAPGITEYVVARGDYNRIGRVDYAPVTTHVIGGEWGQIRGRAIKRVNGVPVVNPSTGLYAYEDNHSFGTVLPDFTGGFTSQLNYKNFNLSFALDFSKGGKYYSLSEFWGSYSGLYANTAGLNDKGNPVRNDLSQGGGVHVTGVSSVDLKSPVDMYVDAIDYFQGNGNNKIHELYIHDASFVKMRELSLSYRFPVSKMGSLNKVFQALQLSVFARNPWLIYSANRNFDPSEFVGIYGESAQMPPSKSYGVTLKFGL